MEATSTIFLLCLHWELSFVLVKVIIMRYNRPTIWTARSVTNVRVHLLTTNGLRTLAGFGDSVDLGLSPHYLLASYIWANRGRCNSRMWYTMFEKRTQTQKYYKNARCEDHFILSPSSSHFVNLIQLDVCSKKHTIAYPAWILNVVKEKIIGAYINVRYCHAL